MSNRHLVKTGIFAGLVIIAVIVVIIAYDVYVTWEASDDTCTLVKKLILPDSCEGICPDGDCVAIETRRYGCVRIPFVGRRCLGRQASKCACTWAPD